MLRNQSLHITSETFFKISSNSNIDWLVDWL